MLHGRQGPRLKACTGGKGRNDAQPKVDGMMKLDSISISLSQEPESGSMLHKMGPFQGMRICHLALPFKLQQEIRRPSSDIQHCLSGFSLSVARMHAHPHAHLLLDQGQLSLF